MIYLMQEMQIDNLDCLKFSLMVDDWLCCLTFSVYYVFVLFFYLLCLTVILSEYRFEIFDISVDEDGEDEEVQRQNGTLVGMQVLLAK